MDEISGDDFDLDTPLNEEEPGIQIENVELSIEDLRAKIAQLSVTSEGEDLRFAMDDLKRALLANPIACSFLTPEDIGETVKYLRQITGKDVALATAKQEIKDAKKSLKAVDFKKLDKAVLDSITDEDLL